MNSESNNNETSELGSDNSLGGEHCDYDDDLDPDCSNSNGTDNDNRVLDDDDDEDDEDDLDDNSNFGDNDEDDEELDNEINFNRSNPFIDYEGEDVNSTVTNSYLSKISNSHLMNHVSNGSVKRVHKNNCHSATIGHGCGGVASTGT